VLDGYEVARRLRQQECGASLLLVAITGYGQESDRARSHEAGFDGHLVKPLELARVLAIAREPRGPGLAAAALG
jgi:CheY-like chemotaxis protein